MIIKTSRLTIRDFHIDDVSALYPILSDEDVMHFSLSGPFSEEKTKTFVQWCINSYQKIGFAQYAVLHSEKLIGYCGFFTFSIQNRSEIELAYRLAKPYWSQGYASEAAKACRDYAFNQLNIKRLISCIDPSNIASIRVAEKTGMVLEQSTHYEGVPILIYSIE